MKVTRDVISDLLPVYEAGEATPDTRALVEAFLRDDPEFARTVADGRRYGEVLKRSPAAPPAAAAEVAALEGTRRLLRRRSWTLALAIFFTCLPFTIAYSDGRVTFFMLRDEPGSALFLLSAAYLWVSYWRQERRLKSTAL